MTDKYKENNFFDLGMFESYFIVTKEYTRILDNLFTIEKWAGVAQENRLAILGL